MTPGHASGVITGHTTPLAVDREILSVSDAMVSAVLTAMRVSFPGGPVRIVHHAEQMSPMRSRALKISEGDKRKGL